MVFKVCIKCDDVIEDQNDQVDYDVFADYFKRDRDDMIYDTVSKPTVVLINIVACLIVLSIYFIHK